MPQFPTEVSVPSNGWIPSAKWICAVCSLLLAVNLVLVIILMELGTTVTLTNLLVALLFFICCVGYLKMQKWVILYTRIIVLLLFIGAGLYWLRTKQWIGLLPSILLLLLILQSNKLESSLKGQPHPMPDGKNASDSETDAGK